jgi:hypothetical protein
LIKIRPTSSRPTRTLVIIPIYYKGISNFSTIVSIFRSHVSIYYDSADSKIFQFRRMENLPSYQSSD